MAKRKSPWVSNRALEVLRLLAAEAERLTRVSDPDVDDEEDGALVQDGNRAYIGLESVSVRTINQLVQQCLISEEDFGGEHSRYYRINESGQKVLADPGKEPEIWRLLREQRALNEAGDAD